MAIFLSYELGFSARFSSAKLHKIVDICKKNRNYFIDNQMFILNFSIDYLSNSQRSIGSGVSVGWEESIPVFFKPHIP